MRERTKNVEEVLARLKSFRPRNPGAFDKAEFEIICFYRYLYACFKGGLIVHPVEYLKRESPDFEIVIVEGVGDSIGLEITRATHRQYMHASKKLEPGIFLDIDFKPRQYRSEAELVQFIRCEEGPAPACLGFNPQDWCDYFIQQINDKTKKLNGPCFRSFSSNELLIYDSTPVSPSLWKLPIYRPRVDYLKYFDYKKTDFIKRFDKIHVLSWDQMYMNIFGEAKCIDISGLLYH